MNDEKEAESSGTFQRVGNRAVSGISICWSRYHLRHRSRNAVVCAIVQTSESRKPLQQICVTRPPSLSTAVLMHCAPSADILSSTLDSLHVFIAQVDKSFLMTPYLDDHATYWQATIDDVFSIITFT